MSVEVCPYKGTFLYVTLPYRIRQLALGSFALLTSKKT